MTDPRWEAWLYERHPRTELRDWATRLRWFRYCRAVGGHANDGDELRLVVRAETERELLATFAALGITPTVLPAGAPQPVPGVAYTAEEYAAFTTRIHRFPHLGQPGQVRVGGQRAFAWVRAGRLELSLSDPDDPYEVTARTVASAIAIEALPAVAALSIIDPPLDDRHCVCPKYHPELFATA